MKKRLVIFLSILATFLIGFGGHALAEDGYITTTSTAQIELVPDIVDFNVEILTTSKESMTKAINENKQTSNKVYNDLKKATDQTKGDSLKTSTYSATPIYKYNNGKKTLEYYQVKNSIKVHTKNISKTGQMIDTAMADGATSVNNISYSVSEYDSECQKLLSEASSKAQSQANDIAKAIGAEITGVKSIEGSCSLAGASTPRIMMSATMTSLDGAVETTSNTNIEVGTMTLTARINASFFVK